MADDPTDWDRLAERVAETLPTLAARSFLTLAWGAVPPVYVQFGQSASELSAHTGSDDVLPPARRLDSAAVERLRGLGWSPPEADPTGRHTWSVAVPWPARSAEHRRLAEMAVGVLRDVHRVPRPEELEYRGWREAEPDPEGVTFDPEDLERYQPHLVFPALGIRDAQAG